MPEGAEEGILKGMYLFRDGRGPQARSAPRVQLLGSGTILREVIAGAELLAKDFGIAADIWSCPSFTELRREAIGGRALEPAAPDRAAARDAMSRRASRDREGR